MGPDNPLAQAERARLLREEAAEQARNAEQRKRDAERYQQEQAKQAADRNRAAIEVAERKRKDEANGYHLIAFRDFVLDGKTLARDEAKISITGFYKKLGEIDLLFPSQIYKITADTYAQGIPLLTDDASRAVREYLYDCQNNLIVKNSPLGCPITIIGHATICTQSIYDVPTGNTAPCIAVEDEAGGSAGATPTSSARIYDHCDDPKNTYADCPPKQAPPSNYNESDRCKALEEMSADFKKAGIISGFSPAEEADLEECRKSALNMTDSLNERIKRASPSTVTSPIYNGGLVSGLTRNDHPSSPCNKLSCLS